MSNTVLKLLISETLVNIARGCFILALGMYLYIDTESIWAFASAFVSDFFIAFILQGWSGKIIDKFGPKNILIASSFACFILFIPFSLFVYYGYGTIILVTLSLLHNAARPFIRGSVFAIVPLAVEKQETQKLNATLSISLQVGQVTGVILAGVGIELIGYAMTFMLVGCAYLAACVCYLTLNIRSTEISKKAPRQSIVSVLLQLFKKYPNFVRSALIGSADFALVGMLNLLIAPTVKYHFNAQTRWLTIIELTFACGAIFAGLMATKLKLAKQYNWRITTSGCLCSAVAFYLMSEQMIIGLFLPLLFFMGFFTTWSSVIWVTYLQSISPPQHLGSLGSIRLIINASLLSIFAAIISYFTDTDLSSGAIWAVYLTLILIMFIAFLQYSSTKTPQIEFEEKYVK